MTLLQWGKQGALITPRCYHTANLLSTNKVLIAGGQGGLETCELYDVATGFFSSTASMKNARFYHTSVTLADNRVLIIGGTNGFSGTLNTCEIYDPATETFSSTGNMNYHRFYHTSTLLDDGRVLVAGGYGISHAGLIAQNESPAYLTSCEIYDPTTEIWSTTGSLAVARNQHGATLLSGGNVLVAGGINKNWVYEYESLDSVEIFDIGTETWSEVASMNYKRDNVNVILMPDSKVFVSNGSSGADRSYSNTCEVYDPTADTWTQKSNLNYNRHYHLADMLNNNQIIAVGGYDYGANGGTVGKTEIYDIISDTWTISDNTETPVVFNTITNIDEDNILILGGLNGGYSANSEIFSAADLEAGVYKIKVDGYFADDVNYFVGPTPLLEEPVLNFEIDTIGSEDFKSIEWKGYFKPTYTGNHTFFTNSDDASYFWIGETAVSGFTTSNALVNNGGLHGTAEQSGTIYLVSGIYYPIRIQFGENGGGAVMEVSYSNAVQAKTQTFTGKLFYNVDTNGF